MSILTEFWSTVKLPPPAVVTVTSKPVKSGLVSPYLFLAVGCFVTLILSMVSFTVILYFADFPLYFTVISSVHAVNPLGVVHELITVLISAIVGSIVIPASVAGIMAVAPLFVYVVIEPPAKLILSPCS